MEPLKPAGRSYTNIVIPIPPSSMIEKSNNSNSSFTAERSHEAGEIERDPSLLDDNNYRIDNETKSNYGMSIDANLTQEEADSLYFDSPNPYMDFNRDSMLYLPYSGSSTSTCAVAEPIDTPPTISYVDPEVAEVERLIERIGIGDYSRLNPNFPAPSIPSKLDLPVPTTVSSSASSKSSVASSANSNAAPSSKSMSSSARSSKQNVASPKLIPDAPIYDQNVLKFKCTISGTICDVMRRRGWIEADDDDDSWNIYWCDINQLREICSSMPKPLEENQRLGHFRNSIEISRKNLMLKNLKRLKSKLEKVYGKAEGEKINFIPLTYILPDEHLRFLDEFRREPALWIIKPAAGAQGRGIFIFAKLKEYYAWRNRFDPVEYQLLMEQQQLQQQVDQDGNSINVVPDKLDSSSDSLPCIIPKGMTLAEYIEPVLPGDIAILPYFPRDSSESEPSNSVSGSDSNLTRTLLAPSLNPNCNLSSYEDPKEKSSKKMFQNRNATTMSSSSPDSTSDFQQASQSSDDQIRNKTTFDRKKCLLSNYVQPSELLTSCNTTLAKSMDNNRASFSSQQRHFQMANHHDPDTPAPRPTIPSLIFPISAASLADRSSSSSECPSVIPSIMNSPEPSQCSLSDLAAGATGDSNNPDTDYTDDPCPIVAPGKHDIYVVQKYILNPFLLGGRKFDIRLYIMVESFAPLKVWLYRDGFARFSAGQFSLAALQDVYVHLTNIAIQRTSDNYNHERGSKWSLFDLKEYLLVTHGRETVHRLTNAIDNIVIRTLQSVQFAILQDRHCFEIFGFDILIDKDVKPWLLEVNASPAFTPSSEPDYRLKCNLIDDTVHVLDIDDRLTGFEKRVGGFDLVWHDGPVYACATDCDGEVTGLDNGPRLNSFIGCRDCRVNQLYELFKIAAYAHGAQNIHTAQHSDQFTRRIYPNFFSEESGFTSDAKIMSVFATMPVSSSLSLPSTVIPFPSSRPATVFPSDPFTTVNIQDLCPPAKTVDIRFRVPDRLPTVSTSSSSASSFHRTNSTNVTTLMKNINMGSSTTSSSIRESSSSLSSHPALSLRLQQQHKIKISTLPVISQAGTPRQRSVTKDTTQSDQIRTVSSSSSSEASRIKRRKAMAKNILR